MGTEVKTRKKLIEVALPLEAINTASAREKSIRHGHPSTLHLWWARRPLAAARAVIFAQMVDDPSSHPELFPTEEAQEEERQRLFKIISDLVQWENTTNETVLEQARDEIWKNWRSTCADNSSHPQAKELFNPEKLPGFHDPFAGGGALPLEAQRLGLESYASDLNPVAVLINKAMIEIPANFANRPPINPDVRKEKALFHRTWHGAEGLAEDLRYYSHWVQTEAEKRIGHLYPAIEITPEIVKGRPDLKSYAGRKLTPIAWIWARTVRSPNPAFAKVEVPLASTFILSIGAGKEAYVEPVIEGKEYHFVVKMGKPRDPETAKNGTKLARGANFQCLMSGTPITGDYIKAEATAGRFGRRLMAVITQGDRGRVYLSPTHSLENAASKAKPTWNPEGAMVEDARAFTPSLYGLAEWYKVFTDRQLVALTTLSDLIRETHEMQITDAVAAGWREDDKSLVNEGQNATAYADALQVYLSFGLSKVVNMSNTLCRWGPTDLRVRDLFARQAIPMTWDFAEANPLADAAGGFAFSNEYLVKALNAFRLLVKPGHSVQADARAQHLSSAKVVSTDPPYYDNVPYADLSDFFYLWLRRSLSSILPDLFATLTVPKADELVATTYRHGGKKKAEEFFLEGMAEAMHRIAEQSHPALPVTIYYAFKQAESNDLEGTVSTGWDTFLNALIGSGLSISGTWPIRTELGNRTRGMDSNALASSVVLVCRGREQQAQTTTRREFVRALKTDLPPALVHLQHANIAPVDLAQAAIGPGMAIYTRYSQVLDASGKSLSVRHALALINEMLDEVLAEQEGDFDADTRWALSWFDQMGFGEGDYGVADTLSKAKNTTVGGMANAGILVQGRGKVRLLKPSELRKNWDPGHGTRLTAWEMVHQLVRSLESDGESSAGELAGKLGPTAEKARELAYRLYTICERKKRSQEALSYNGLVQSWPEIARLAREGGGTRRTQSELFEENEA
jgi:putative DNA methylase